MCTGIKINYDNGCIMGRTMDFEHPIKYNGVYLPRNYNICNDLMGSPIYAKYKTMGICFENRTPLKDGVNEHGLVGITNAFSGFNLYDNRVKDNKFNISSLDFLTYTLSNYKSVEELVRDLPNIHMSTRDYMGEDVICPDFHHMFTDSSKRAIVIEPKRKELVIYENPYDIMTNSPGFESHVKRLKKLIDLENMEGFNSSKDLPGGYDPFSRFIKAFHLTKMNIKPRDYQEAFSHFYNIMGAMVMPEGFVTNRKYDETTYTRYICGYDTENRLLTVKSHTNPKVYQLSFDDIKDEEKRQEFYIDQNFMMEKLK